MEKTMIIFALEDLRDIIREEVEAATKKTEVKNELPPVLTRVQVMEVLQIGHEKASELFGRGDFPVCREAGGVKVRTEKLFAWMDKHTSGEEELPKRIRSIS